MLSACVTSSSSVTAANRVGHDSRQPDVVGDHRAVAGGADVLQRQPHLERAEAARVLRAVVDVVGRLLVEVVVRRVIGKRRPQRAPDRAPARIRPRAAHTATCADRPRPSRPSLSPRRSSGASGTAAAKPP